MRFLENLKRRLGMAKRFKGGIKEDVVEEIAKRVAEEDIEEMIEIKEDISFDLSTIIYSIFLGFIIPKCIITSPCWNSAQE